MGTIGQPVDVCTAPEGFVQLLLVETTLVTSFNEAIRD